MISSAEEFVKLRDSEVREEYLRAAHETASIEVWLDVIKKYPGYKEWVVLNKTVPLEILEILVNDDNPNVRHAVAMKKKISIELLMKLAQDSDPSVRQRVAYNSQTPKSVLKLLSKDPVVIVSQKAVERLKNL